MVLVLAAEELPPGIAAGPLIEGPQGPMMEVVVLGLAMPSGAWLTVAVPASTLLPVYPTSPSPSLTRELPRSTMEPNGLLEIAREARRSLDPELTALGSYFAFLETVTTAQNSIHSSAAANRVHKPHSAGGLRC